MDNILVISELVELGVPNLTLTTFLPESESIFLPSFASWGVLNKDPMVWLHEARRQKVLAL